MGQDRGYEDSEGVAVCRVADLLQSCRVFASGLLDRVGCVSDYLVQLSMRVFADAYLQLFCQLPDSFQIACDATSLVDRRFEYQRQVPDRPLMQACPATPPPPTPPSPLLMPAAAPAPPPL